MKLYVVRHGETDWNVLHRVQGRTNTKLNAKGIKQAEELAEQTALLPIDICISSPLDRTVHTAKTIYHGEIIFDDRLMERDYGKIEGTIPTEWGDIWNVHKPTDGPLENITALVGRVNEVLDEIKTKYAGKNVLVVTHGGVIRCIRAYFEGVPAGGNLRDLHAGNCEIFTYDMN